MPVKPVIRLIGVARNPANGFPARPLGSSRWSVRDRSDILSRRKIIPFTSLELPYTKYHGLRALCGLFMDRHSACTVCPFCGSIDDADIEQVIVHVESQIAGETGEPLVALYFCKAKFRDNVEADSIEQWASWLQYAEDVPFRKAVVRLLDNGAYYAEYGPIANPTKGDYSTGMLDGQEWTLSYHCDPEPAHTRWQYWESDITPQQKVVPEFRCLQVRGAWWIVDIDRERRMVQQVAAMTVADNPNHLVNQQGRPGDTVGPG